MIKKLTSEYEKAVDENLNILNEYEVFSEEFDLYSLDNEELLEVKKAVEFFLDGTRKFKLNDEKFEVLTELLPEIEILLNEFNSLLIDNLNID